MQNLIDQKLLDRLVGKRIESLTIYANWYEAKFRGRSDPPEFCRTTIHQSSKVVLQNGLEYVVSTGHHGAEFRPGLDVFWADATPLTELLESDVVSCRINDDWTCWIEFENGCWLTVETKEPWPF